MWTIFLKFQARNDFGARSESPVQDGTFFAFGFIRNVLRPQEDAQGLMASRDRYESSVGNHVSPCQSNQVKEHPKMRNRRHTLLWMKDLIEHMSRCHDQLEWASDGDTQTFLADAMIGDLNECQKLCEQLRTVERRQGRAHALAAT